MSAAANFAGNPRIDYDVITNADVSRTAPAVFVSPFVAGNLGSRIDEIDLVAIGDTVAGLLRLFEAEGKLGVQISSITFAATTATVTTATSHGLSTGNLVTVQGAFPAAYNVKQTAITVTSLTTFTYVMGSTPTINAAVVGFYSSCAASPRLVMIKEIPVIALTTSTTAPVFNAAINSSINRDILPYQLPAGYHIRATVSTTQTASGIAVICRGADF